MWPITVGRGEAGIESRREGLTQNQGWDLGSAAETPETCLELCFNSSLGLQGVSPPTFLDLDVESHCSRGGTGRNESVVVMNMEAGRTWTEVPTVYRGANHSTSIRLSFLTCETGTMLVPTP